MLKKIVMLLSASVALVGASFAQDTNLEKLGGFKTTGTPMMVPIPQPGENAEALRF